MNNNRIVESNQKVSTLIENNPYFLLLLEHFGINLPVQDKNIKTICEESNVSVDLFCAFADVYNGYPVEIKYPFVDKDAIDILRFLKNTHALYSEQIYPAIMLKITKMSQKNTHKEMMLVTTFFKEYSNEVVEHLNYENTVFHPYVKWMYCQLGKKEYAQYVPTANKEEKQYCVATYKKRHNDIEEKLNDLKNLLIKYLPFENDQIERRELLLLLSMLEFDLKIHSEIEEMVLMPLALDMEKRLNKLKK